ncbi:hypothetical protein CTheo_5097 [Ceratobasidium theobromae]|uniref:Uncharacterized protein n=1 Tax=Ceratobasidium theobromae TaxID=1582974 RepID=A0A5N5QI83_9AGAM|nr:hypothetical protein CTheo_5097 [Ceratobasidium theobromae]
MSTQHQIDHLLDNSPGDLQLLTLDQMYNHPDPVEALQKVTSVMATASRSDAEATDEVLAFLCLRCMNLGLGNIPGLGYLSQKNAELRGIPKITMGQVPEVLWYACQNWIGHVLDVTRPLPVALLEELQDFLANSFTPWIELISACARYEGLSSFLEWVETLGVESSINLQIINLQFSRKLQKLADRFELMDRRMEALLVAYDRVEVLEQLCEDSPSVLNSAELARSHYLRSKLLVDFKCYEESVTESTKAIDIQRELHKVDPNYFRADLAGSLSTRSNALTYLGRHAESLEVIEEAIEIYRRLAADNPFKFNPDLAESIQHMSNGLSSLKRHEESLTAVREALEIRRQLASNYPATYDPEVAQSLHSLGVCLNSVKRNEEALVAKYQSVEIFRRLVSDRPEVFTSDLAEHLVSLSNLFSEMELNEEALTSCAEAVGIYRRLGVACPAVWLEELGGSLSKLALKYSACNRYKEALNAAEESREIYQSLTTSPRSPTQEILQRCRDAASLAEIMRSAEAREATAASLRQ